MKLLITTQVYENYAWREDGTLGTGTEAYWKAKGGDEYVVTGIWDEDEATTAVMCVREQIEKATDAYTETIIDWKLLDEDELTPFEQDQMEYEGQIMFPAKVIEWA